MTRHSKIVMISALITLLPFGWLFYDFSEASGAGNALFGFIVFGFPFAIILFAVPYTIGIRYFDKPEAPQAETSSNGSILGKLVALTDRKYWVIAYWAVWVVVTLAFIMGRQVLLNPPLSLSPFSLFIIYGGFSVSIILFVRELENYRLVNYLNTKYSEEFPDIFYVPMINLILPWQNISNMKTVFRYYRFMFSGEDFGDMRLKQIKSSYRKYYFFSWVASVSLPIYLFAFAYGVL